MGWHDESRRGDRCAQHSREARDEWSDHIRLEEHEEGRGGKQAYEALTILERVFYARRHVGAFGGERSVVCAMSVT